MNESLLTSAIQGLDRASIPERHLLATRDDPQGGSGLGLNVSRAIIECYGGTISVSSTPERGAIFSISLPDVRSADVIPEPPTLQHTGS